MYLPDITPMDLILTPMTFIFKYDGKVICVDTLFYPRYTSESNPRTSRLTFSCQTVNAKFLVKNQFFQLLRGKMDFLKACLFEKFVLLINTHILVCHTCICVKVDPATYKYFQISAVCVKKRLTAYSKNGRKTLKNFLGCFQTNTIQENNCSHDNSNISKK